MPMVLVVIGSVIAVVVGQLPVQRTDRRIFRQMQGSPAKNNPFEVPAPIQPEWPGIA